MLKKLVGLKESELYVAIAVGLIKAENFRYSLHWLEGHCVFASSVNDHTTKCWVTPRDRSAKLD
jgi:hypothetical protein